MKCPHCGNFSSSSPCAFCGEKLYDSSPLNKLHKFFSRKVKMGSIELKMLSLVILIIINISVLTFVANCITYYACNIKVAWCQYVICGITALYTFAQCSRAESGAMLKHIRRAFYVLYASFAITDVLSGNNMLTLQFASPIILVVLCVIALGLFFTKTVSAGSLGLTSAINSGLASLSLVISFVAKERFTTVGLIFTYVSFGICVLILLNFILLWAISLSNKFNKIL